MNTTQTLTLHDPVPKIATPEPATWLGLAVGIVVVAAYLKWGKR